MTSITQEVNENEYDDGTSVTLKALRRAFLEDNHSGYESTNTEKRDDHIEGELSGFFSWMGGEGREAKPEPNSTKAASKRAGVKTRTRLFDKYGRFVAVPYEFIERGVNLTAKARVMFLVLRSFTNETTDKTFPAYNAIKARAGHGFRRQEDVADALNELERFGWMRRKRNGARSNDYELTKPRTVSPTPEEAKQWKTAILERNRKRRGKSGRYASKSARVDNI